MKVQLLKKNPDGVSSARDDILVKGAEIHCPELSKGRIVLERFRLDDGLLVLRMGRTPAKPKPKPSHFLVLEIAEGGDGVWVESEPVMVLPARKNGFVRDVPRLEGEVD